MSVTFDFSGLDELEEKVENACGQVRFENLFTNSFMQEHTHFASLEEMFDKSGFAVKTADDFEAIPDAEWDNFISKNTNFKNWQDMLNRAAAEYVARSLN